MEANREMDRYRTLKWYNMHRFLYYAHITLENIPMLATTHKMDYVWVAHFVVQRCLRSVLLQQIANASGSK